MLKNIIGLLRKDSVKITKKVRSASTVTMGKVQENKLTKEQRKEMVLPTKRYIDALVEIDKRTGLFKSDIEQARQFLKLLKRSQDESRNT